MNKAMELGAIAAGIIPAGRPAGLERFYRWLDEGCSADMTYLSSRRNAYADQNSILPNVQSLMVLVFPQLSLPPMAATAQSVKQPAGKIAYYAQGEDYHRTIRLVLKQLASLHRQLYPAGNCRGVVDTAPLLEKDAALSACVGYIGRNTLLQCGKYGSRVHLAVLLSTEKWKRLSVTEKKKKDARTGSINSTPSDYQISPMLCGECRNCIQACPTGALSDSGLDARKCLSYWLIEHRGDIPDEIALKAGNRLFGCDTCQDVCPHNPRVAAEYINIESVLSMTADDFQTRFENTPVSRCGLDGLKRNAEIVKRNANRQESIGQN